MKDNLRILAIGDFHGKFSEKLKKEAKKVDLIIVLGDYTGLDFWRPYVKENFKRIKKGLPRLGLEDYFGKKKAKLLVEEDFKTGENIIKELDKLKKPVISVFGNGDWHKHAYYKTLEGSRKKGYEWVVSKTKNISDITYKNKKLLGLNFAGFGGYMDVDAYFDKDEFDEEVMDVKRRIKIRERGRKNFFKRLGKVQPDIFVLHYPPSGFFDIIKLSKDNPMNRKSAGIRFFREAAVKFKPKLVLCGHMHEYQGKKMLGKSLVVSVGCAQSGKAAIISWPSLKVRFLR